MLYEKFKQTLLQKFSKHTDPQLLELENKFREHVETDAAELCNEILLSRRNQGLNDEVQDRRRGLAATDEDFLFL